MIAPLKMKSFFILAFLLCISTGYGLKCYKCVSTTGWDDCASVQKEVFCPSHSPNRCGNVLFSAKSEEGSVTNYGKGCVLSSACSHKSELCKSADPSVKIIDCEFDCCSGNLCNGVPVPVVSAIILLACALVASLVAFLY